MGFFWSSTRKESRIGKGPPPRWIGALPEPGDELGATEAYLEAHELLPPEERIDTAELDRLVTVLEGGSEPGEVLRALVTLAHVGRPALTALRAYADRPDPGLDLLAVLALEECEVWADDPDPPIRIRRPVRREAAPRGSD